VYIPLFFWKISSQLMSLRFYPFAWGSNFRFHIEEWRVPVLCIFILKNFWTKVGLNVLFRIPNIWANFATCYWKSFSLSWDISKPRYLEFFTCCKHLLPTIILLFTVSYPKNDIVSDFSDDISIPKFFAMFRSVNIPLCRLSSELFSLYPIKWIHEHTVFKGQSDYLILKI
jgi:hypothetical protein